MRGSGSSEQRPLPLQHLLRVFARLADSLRLAHLGRDLLPAGKSGTRDFDVLCLTLDADDLIPAGAHGADHLGAGAGEWDKNAARSIELRRQQ